MSAHLRGVAVVALALALAACATTTDPTQRQALPVLAVPRTLAVLPLEAPDGKQDGALVVRRILNNHLAGTTYDIVKLGVVDDHLHRSGMTPAELSRTSSKEVGGLLGVDALLYGTLTHYDRFFAIAYSHVAVGVKLRLVQASTGAVLWQWEEAVRIHAGGIPLSPWGIAFTAASAAMNLRDVELLHATDDLARKAVVAMPVPPAVHTRRPPLVETVLSDAAGKSLKAGDVVTVLMRGEQGKTAGFDVVPIARGVAMTEAPEGIYTGKYTVRPGDNAAAAYVVTRLVDAGRMAEREDVRGRFVVDTTPPGPVTGLAVASRAGGVRLRWRASPGADLAGYRVSRSTKPLSEFAVVGTVESPEFRDESGETGTGYYYRVTAVDRAGNEGEPSETVSAISLPAGPTRVSGMIEGEATWHAESGPFLLAGDVVVASGATLSIRPGVEIRAEGSFAIRGRLLASGTPDRPITFTSAAGNAWAGLVFESEHASTLAHCDVRGAVIGVSIKAGRLTATDCSITGGGGGMAVAAAGASAALERVRVERNGKDGIVVANGARLTLSGGSIVDNGGDGLRVEASAPDVRTTRIAGNKGWGVRVVSGQPTLRGNDLQRNAIGQIENAGADPVDLDDNYFGSVEVPALVAGISGRIQLGRVLDAATDGKVTALPIAPSPLPAAVSVDLYLVPWQSPYRLDAAVTIAAGATLRILPGVVVRFARSADGFVVDGGRLLAHGTTERPVVFTSSSSSPTAGDYRTVVRVTPRAGQASVLDHVTLEYATVALRVEGGSLEVANAVIRRNRQGGLDISGDASVKIARSRLEEHAASAAVTVRGFGRVSLRDSWLSGNGWAVVNYSANQVEAARNWWGSPAPDASLFVGDVDHRDPLAVR